MHTELDQCNPGARSISGRYEDGYSCVIEYESDVPGIRSGRIRFYPLNALSIIRLHDSGFVQDHRQDGVTDALNEVYGPGEVKAELDPILKQLQGASIAREEW